MGFGVAISKSKSCPAIVISSGIIDDIPRSIRVGEEATIVDAFLALVEDDPQSRRRGLGDGIDLPIKLVLTRRGPGAVGFTERIVHGNAANPRPFLPSD